MHRPLALPDFVSDPGAGSVGRRHPRVEADRLVVICDRFISLAQAVHYIGTVEVWDGVSRRELDRSVEVGEGLIVAAQCEEREAAVRECTGVFRIELDCLAQVSDRLLVLTETVVGRAPILIGRRTLGIESYGCRRDPRWHDRTASSAPAGRHGPCTRPLASEAGE